jgi:hypothetical protein
MNENIFLIANIDSEKIHNESTNWITSTGLPYIKIDPIDITDSLKSKLLNMYIQTYKNLGKRLHIDNTERLLDYTRWIIINNKNGVAMSDNLMRNNYTGGGSNDMNKQTDNIYADRGLYNYVKERSSKKISVNDIQAPVNSEEEKINDKESTI